MRTSRSCKRAGILLGIPVRIAQAFLASCVLFSVVRNPLRAAFLPAEWFLTWHEREIFKPPPRELQRA